MSVMQKQDIVPPLSIMGMLHSQWAAYALRAALKLNLFQALKDSPQTAEAVARKLGCDTKGTMLLLDAMVGVNLLSKNKNTYALTEVSQHYLLPDGPLFLGRYINSSEEMYKRWAELPQAIKTGKPMMQVNTDEEAQSFFPELTRGIYPLNYATAETVGRALNIERLPAGSRILDLAAGSAVWSIPLAKCNPEVKVDALDFPIVLEVAREFVKREGVAKQYSYLEGNWRDVKLEDGVYDVIILGHILHSEGEEYSRQLIAKCLKAIKPAGRLIIAEFFANDERTAPAHPLMFGLNMFLFTSDGCIFSPREVEKMCTEAGFSKASRLPLAYYGEDSPIVVAVK